MTYVKSYWQPNESESGKFWRDTFNAYMKDNITLDSYKQLMLDISKPQFWPEIKSKFQELEFGEHLRSIHGPENYNSLMKKFERTKSLEDLDFLRDKLELFYKFVTQDVPINNTGTISILNGRFNIFGLISKNKAIKSDEYAMTSINRYLTKAFSESEKSKRDQGFFLSASLHTAFNYSSYYLEVKSMERVIRKTWSNPNQMENWTNNEFELILQYFTQYQFGLNAEKESDGLFSPESIEFSRSELDEGIHGDPYFGLHLVFMCEFVSDFIDELLAYNRHHSKKGSAICQECGSSYPRSFYGHGQLYCTSQCKNRVAKNRYRAKLRSKKYKI